MKNADANFFSQLKKSLFFLTVVLSACSHIEQPPRSTPWLPENTPPNFHTTGKLSIKNDQQGFQAGFAWDNASWVKMIDITTPLGSTVGRLCQDEMGATAQNAKGQVFQAKTAGELAYRLTGQEIPLDYFFYDKDRNCYVYFPSYYPNGDYHFFITNPIYYAM